MLAIKRIYRQSSIKVKGIVFMLLLVLYPIILLGYFGYSNYEKMITQNFMDNVKKDVAVAGEQLQDKLADVELFMKQIQYDEKIFKIATTYYNILHEQSIELKYLDDPGDVAVYQKFIMNDYSLKVAISNHLQSLMLSRADIDIGAFQFVKSKRMGFIEARNKSQAYTNYMSFERNNIFLKIEEMFQDGQNTAYYIDEEDNIYIGQRLYHRYTGEHFATITFRLDMAYMLESYESMLEGAKEAIYIMGSTQSTNVDLLEVGNLDEDKKYKLNSFVDSSPNMDILYKEEHKTNPIIYRAFIHENLIIGNAIYISNTILLEEIRAMSRITVMLCLSILPIFILLANRLYKDIVHPIYILGDNMQQIEQGKLGKQISVDRTDEIGYLYSSFNRMSKRLQYLINCVYREQLELKNAEIKSLQSQINPHFLYNTLEMINWKARMYGDTGVSEMIEALAGILEINIDRRSSPCLTLEEEMNYIKNYIFLIQKRFGDRIGFGASIDETLLQYKIPRLLLQPLVENAINHGIEPLGEGVISINVKEKGKDLEIIISDNGQGIERTNLYKLQSQLEHSEAHYIEHSQDDKGHIGLINGQRRIKLLYGEEYGMAINSEKDQGTQVIIVLPKEK